MEENRGFPFICISIFLTSSPSFPSFIPFLSLTHSRLSSSSLSRLFLTMSTTPVDKMYRISTVLLPYPSIPSVLDSPLLSSPSHLCSQVLSHWRYTVEQGYGIYRSWSDAIFTRSYLVGGHTLAHSGLLYLRGTRYLYRRPTVSHLISGCTCTLVNFLDNEELSLMKWTSSRHINHVLALMDIYSWWGKRNLIFEL